MKKLILYIIFFSPVSIISNLNAQVDPGTENLTHSWTFDDGTASDQIGGAAGILSGSAVIIDSSLFTTDPDSWLELPADVISLNSYSEITLETWFIPLSTANTGYHMLAFFGNTVNSVGNDYYFITPARGDDVSRAAISCGVVTSPWTGETGANGPELNDTLLHHMVSTLTDTNITLYIDGELQASEPLDTNNSIAKIAAAYAYLAKGGYTGDPTWRGEILEFNIYNRALSLEEILFLYSKHAVPTSVDEGLTMLPVKYDLLQNFPNPFNPETKIVFDLPEESHVKITISDMLGREVAILLNEIKTAGRHYLQFKDENISSGVYIYRLEAGNKIFSKKMILLR
jgi:hypothetical protein